MPVSPPLFCLIKYVNSNYAGNSKDRKSVIGTCFFLQGVIVFWYSKKQHTVLTSTTKVEYIALKYIEGKSVWIRQFLNKLKIEISIRACLLHGDNETSIILTNNTESPARPKHIDVQYHYIRKLVADKKVEIEWIYHGSILADGFTKVLSANSFKRYWDLLNLTSWYK